MCSVSLENIQSLDLGILLLGSYPEEIFGDADSDLCARVLIAANAFLSFFIAFYCYKFLQ